MSAITKDRGRAMAPVGSGERSRAIDGIRGMAALALLTVHVAMFSGLLGTKALGEPRPPSNWLGAFFVSGLPSFIGVFFVFPALFLYLPLAKAIISGNRRPPQGSGLLRRLLRLLPAYYAMYFVVLLTLNRDAIDGLWYILRPILLLQVYLPSPFVPKLMNGMEITWTVPTMVQWYLILPLIAWAVHRFAERGATPAIRARRLMLPVPILIAIGIGWLFFVKAHNWDNRIVFWWPQGFAPTIGIGMMLAIMLALAKVSPESTPKLLRLGAAKPNLFWLAALVVYLVNCVRPFSVIGMDAIYSVSGLLVTYLMVALFGLFAVVPLVSPGARPHLVSNFLGNRPLAYVGRVSYGIYLWHFAVMHFYLQPGAIFGGEARPLREFYGSAGFWELELVTVAGALIFATLSYYLIEQPIAGWAEKRIGNGRQRRATPAQARPPVPDWPGASDPPAQPMTADEAGTAVASEVANRDAIGSNLLDLEGSFGRQVLSDANLTGQTRKRWQSASADLAALWELYTAYTSVVDSAASLVGGGRQASAAELDRVTNLLTGPSIVVAGAPVPLARRHITDTGLARLTPAAAIGRMNELFTKTAALVTTVETVRSEVTRRLDDVGADLTEARRRTRELDDDAVHTALAEAEAALRRHRQTLQTDPLSFWQKGKVDTSDLEALRQRIGTPPTPAARRPTEGPGKSGPRAA